MQKNRSDTGSSFSSQMTETRRAVQYLQQIFEKLNREITNTLDISKAATQMEKTVKTTVRKVGRTLASFDELDKLAGDSVTSVTTTVKTTGTSQAGDAEQSQALAQTVTADTGVLRFLGNLLHLFRKTSTSAQEASESVGFLDGILQKISDKNRQSGESAASAASAVTGLAGAWMSVGTALSLWKEKSTDMQATIRSVEMPVVTASAAVSDLETGVLRLSDSLAGAKTSAQTLAEGIRGSWGGLGEWFKTNVGNKIIDGTNGLLSGIVQGVNKVLSGLNGISISVPDWIPGIGGKSVSFGLKNIAVPQIPQLAAGAVLPANRPFLAVVGDQKNGTNVEAPLETIKQAVAEVLGNAGSGDVVINFTGDLAQLARILRPEIQREDRRVGGAMVRKEIL